MTIPQNPFQTDGYMKIYYWFVKFWIGLMVQTGVVVPKSSKTCRLSFFIELQCLLFYRVGLCANQSINP